MATRTVCSQCGAPLRHEQDVSVTEPPPSQLDSADELGVVDDTPTSLDHDSEPVTLTDVVSRFDEHDAIPTGSDSSLEQRSRYGANTRHGALTPHQATVLHGASHARAVSVAGTPHGEPVVPWAANISNLVPIWRTETPAGSAQAPVRVSSGVRNLLRAVVVVAVASLAYYLGYRQSTGQQAVTSETGAGTVSSGVQAADGVPTAARDEGARSTDTVNAVEAAAPIAGSGTAVRPAAGGPGAGARDASTLAALPAAAGAAAAPVDATARSRPAPVRRAAPPAAPSADPRTGVVGGAAIAPPAVKVEACTAAIAALGLCTPDPTARKESP